MTSFKTYHYYFFTFFLINSFLMFSQNEIKYFGVLKLNDSSFISYRINIKETNGIIKGYSITDIGGNHETKSNISGTYNSKTGDFVFKEYGIIYTKSIVDKYDFCFVNFKGKLSKVNNQKSIKGKFKGLYSDGKKCIDGEIKLMSEEKVIKKAVAVDKKIQKMKKITPEQKEKVSVQKSIDTLTMNILKENQNMSFFTKSNKVKISIFDSGKEDGDKVCVYVDKKKFLDDLYVSKKTKILEIPIQNKQTLIEIEALNEGEISPNTADIELLDNENTIKTISKLKKGKRTRITVINLGLN